MKVTSKFRLLLPTALLIMLGSNNCLAADYYVAITGSDTAGQGTTGSPWGTIGYGINQLASGDTLIVKAGTYLGRENFINSRLSALPSGTPGNYTTIKAESPLTAVIRNSGSINYYDNLLRLEGNYIHVDGFVIDMINQREPEYNAEVTGNYNKITQSLFRREGDVNEFGGWVSILGDYNLVEDSAGVGAARYGFYTGGPTSSASQNIFRRIVARVDYSNSLQPKSAFAAYGNNDGHNMHDVLFQNCIAIDGRRGPTGSEETYGGFYFPKNAANVTVQGSIVLNNEAAHAGYFAKELHGENIRLEHSIAWDVYGTSYIAGVRINGAGGPYFGMDHMTIGESPVAYYNQDSAQQRVMTNSLLHNNGARSNGSDYGWTSATHNAFSPAPQATGSNSVTGNVDLKYILRAESDSALVGAASDSGNIGADVTQQYGVSGTLWGEPGYDQRTTNNLWPWNHEDTIKQWFSVTNNPPAGNVPSTNNTIRGFTVANDQFGKSMTLTRYIWQYLGNEIPAGIYTISSISTPTGASATKLP